MIVIGADTHKRTHTVAAVFAASGQLAGELTAPAREPGFRELLAWGAPSTQSGSGRWRTAATSPALSSGSWSPWASAWCALRRS